jgi:hypothetical protein
MPTAAIKASATWDGRFARREMRDEDMKNLRKNKGIARGGDAWRQLGGANLDALNFESAQQFRGERKDPKHNETVKKRHPDDQKAPQF